MKNADGKRTIRESRLGSRGDENPGWRSTDGGSDARTSRVPSACPCSSVRFGDTSGPRKTCAPLSTTFQDRECGDGILRRPMDELTVDRKVSRVFKIADRKFLKVSDETN